MQIKSNSVLQSLSLPWKFAVLEPERPGASLFSCVLLEDEPRALFKLKLSMLRVYKRVCVTNHATSSVQHSSRHKTKKNECIKFRCSKLVRTNIIILRLPDLLKPHSSIEHHNNRRHYNLQASFSCFLHAVEILPTGWNC